MSREYSELSLDGIPNWVLYPAWAILGVCLGALAYQVLVTIGYFGYFMATGQL
jgi:hypothetical protein